VEKLCGEAEKEPKAASKSTDFGEKTGVFAMFLPKKGHFFAKVESLAWPKELGRVWNPRTSTSQAVSFSMEFCKRFHCLFPVSSSLFRALL